MRTTLDIDEKVLNAARILAEQQGISLGKAVSQMAHRGIRGDDVVSTGSGFPMLPRNGIGHVITDELVSQYRDDS
ncbi:MAG: hypothetical protein WBA28_08425 [Microbacteriaceae bacterium]